MLITCLRMARTSEGNREKVCGPKFDKRTADECTKHQAQPCQHLHDGVWGEASSKREATQLLGMRASAAGDSSAHQRFWNHINNA